MINSEDVSRLLEEDDLDIETINRLIEQSIGGETRISSLLRSLIKITQDRETRVALVKALKLVSQKIYRLKNTEPGDVTADEETMDFLLDMISETEGIDDILSDYR